MDPKTLSSLYFSAMDEGFEVVETSEGFAVWMPAYYSDGDGVILSVRPAPGGWYVTDDGQTFSHLAGLGAAVSGPAFTTAWDTIARPAGAFVPGDKDPMGSCQDAEILAWATDETIGQVLRDISHAALRAEGLAYTREPRTGGRPFSMLVRDRARRLLTDRAFSSRGLEAGDGSLRLTSGRTKKVTETITRHGSVVAAVQAMGGKTRETREQAHEHCYTIFSQSDLPIGNRLAVVNDACAWDAGVLREAEQVANLVRINDLDDLEPALLHLADQFNVVA
ncbi:Uncharacterised protein [Actinomyces bovis]|uniref:DUF1828 domain-containing protein n=1 Tax=Actinomyces bovis TaxID=1658 RepID=A0ABY1VPD2_9ACTO|nr:hypothetical protein [Actinomyces bovis]SPT53087.1 Uncharacterised protein [Actinomyces bovis]SPT53769.1 Uncharacterised protein [Actinomyces bovis]VEG53110.1 Uncharacterised protein [Actinomyces israelii]